MTFFSLISLCISAALLHTVACDQSYSFETSGYTVNGRKDNGKITCIHDEIQENLLILAKSNDVKDKNKYMVKFPLTKTSIERMKEDNYLSEGKRNEGETKSGASKSTTGRKSTTGKSTTGKSATGKSSETRKKSSDTKSSDTTSDKDSGTTSDKDSGTTSKSSETNSGDSTSNNSSDTASESDDTSTSKSSSGVEYYDCKFILDDESMSAILSAGSKDTRSSTMSSRSSITSRGGGSTATRSKVIKNGTTTTTGKKYVSIFLRVLHESIRLSTSQHHRLFMSKGRVLASTHPYFQHVVCLVVLTHTHEETHTQV
eukprot:GHVR01059165.1.p1 GENE.GHVR01059165.1~~GHVR01059165.1.p1  ORF type:complete len:323 (+),score=78.83 GHVR01059165.1:25-969(+)